MNAHDLMNKVEKGLETLASLTAKARSSEEVLAYMDFMSQFHNYSFYNTVSIFFHCPTATHVAGYVAWQKLGRYVRKGEVGIPILAPCFKKKKDAIDEDETDRTIAFYKVVYIFDISQTDGEPLPEAPIIASGSDQGLLSVLEQITAKHGIHLKYKPFTGSHHGTSYGGKYQDHGLVFASAVGTPIGPDNLRRHFKRTLEGAGLPDIRIHDLRHTFASLLLEEGEELVVISRMLGHSSIAVTADIYAHVSKKMKTDAVNKLDSMIFGGDDSVKEEPTPYLIA